MERSHPLWNVLLIAMTFHWQSTDGYTYHWGACPKFESVPNFSMQRFSGHWYAVYIIDTKSSCWTYDFVVDKNTSTSRVLQTRNQLVDVVDPEEFKQYVGILEVPFAPDPATMTVTYPDNMAGKLDFVVFATDYDHYGAIFSCQRILFGHRQTAVILSRKPYLEQVYAYKARSILMSHGIDLEDMHRIGHTGCKYPPPPVETNYNITLWDY